MSLVDKELTLDTFPYIIIFSAYIWDSLLLTVN